MLGCISSKLYALNLTCLLPSSQHNSKPSLHKQRLQHKQSLRVTRCTGIRCVSGPDSPPSNLSHQPIPVSVTALEAASDSMSALVSRPAFLIAAAVGFSIIAFDVNSSASLHFLPHYVDQPTHAWVKANLPTQVKKLVAEKLVSDLFITGGIGGCIIAGAAGVKTSGWAGIRRAAIALLIYIYGAGSVRHGDPFVVEQLKTHFQRMRPSDILNTYSFPSGHTTAAVFTMGTLLCILLPPLTVDSDNRRSSRLQTVATSVALPLWVIAAVTTAAGRVLGDAHWVSDTMAGACLGAALVSITTMLCSRFAADPKP